MMENEFTKPVRELGKSTLDYVDLKIDDIKLRTAKGLSVTLHKLFLAMLFITVGGIVLMAAAFGAVLLIGKLLDDYAAGAFIVAGVFLIVLLVLYLLRNKLFIRNLISMFIRLFFEDKNEIRRNK